VDDHAGGVDHAHQRRPHRRAQPRVGTALDRVDGFVSVTAPTWPDASRSRSAAVSARSASTSAARP
jgi:hypothetical protein